MKVAMTDHDPAEAAAEAVCDRLFDPENEFDVSLRLDAKHIIRDAYAAQTAELTAAKAEVERLESHANTTAGVILKLADKVHAHRAELTEAKAELVTSREELSQWQRRSGFNRSVALSGETWTQEAEDRAADKTKGGRDV
jgi:hypothetical protein